MQISRRDFLGSSVRGALGAGLATGLGGLLPALARADGGKPKTIVLRSSWQTVNIGDIAHTPGVLHLMEEFAPEAQVILWPSSITDGVEQMLRNRFPKLRIVDVPKNRRSMPTQPTDIKLEDAIAQADIFVNGSGPSWVAGPDFVKHILPTGKPYGAYGITIDLGNDPAAKFNGTIKELVDGAQFVYTRETLSLNAIKKAGATCPDMRFSPDGTFACDLQNESAAEKLLAEHSLEPDEFICVIPRLRFSPYWYIHPNPKRWTPELIEKKDSANKKYAQEDHGKLRDVIVAWVRETGKKVFCVPEMEYQVALMGELLYDKLPEDVKPKVEVMKRYWLTDEACSVYRRSRAMVSCECHSPILSLVNRRPAFYVQQPTDTWKGEMYADVGVGDWRFKIEQTTGEQLAKALLEVNANYDKSLAQVDKAMEFAHKRMAETMEHVVSLAGVPAPSTAL